MLAAALPAQTPASEAGVNPSRPSRTNSPDLGATGYLEAAIGGAHTTGTSAVPALLKYTVTDHWELRVGSDLLVNETAAGVTRRRVGSTSAWVQWAPFPGGDEGVRWALGAGTVLPTGQGTGLATSAWDYNAGLAVAQPIGAWRWDANLSVRSSAAPDDASPRGTTVGASFVAARSLGARWTPFAEVSAEHERGTSGTRRWSMAGVSLSVGPRVVLDAAVETPLGHGRAEYLTMAGISVLLGNLR